MIAKPEKRSKGFGGFVVKTSIIVVLAVVAVDGWHYYKYGCSQIGQTCPAPPTLTLK